MPPHMRTPTQVEALAGEKYDAEWVKELRHPVTSGYTIALAAPAARSIAQNPAAVDQWLREWAQWGRRHPEVSLRTKTVRVEWFGTQELFTHAEFPTAAALASFDETKHEHWRRACYRWEQIGDRFDPPTQVDAKMKPIVDLIDADFGLLLEAADWFRKNPRSGLTIRRIPVPGMHTKWLKRHRQLVLAFLGHTAAASAASDEHGAETDLPPSELDALGLKPLPPEIDILVLDRALRQDLGGLRTIRAPLGEIAALPIKPRQVLIVENKEAALPLHDRPSMVVLHSLGNHLDGLTQIPWLPPTDTWYWGDLDRHGFTLLSRARARHPGLKALLMNPESLAEYWHLDTGETDQRWDEPEPTLTYLESEALHLIRRPEAPHVRIEQERLPTEAIEAALDRRPRTP